MRNNLRGLKMFLKKVKSFFKKLNDNHNRKLKEIIVFDDKRRRAVFCIVGVALSVISLAMSIINIFTGEKVLMVVTFAFSIISLINVLLVIFFKKIEKPVCIAFMLEDMALLAFFIVSGIPNGFSALWVCLIPSFAMFVFGLKIGCGFSAAAFLMLVFFYWIPFGKSLLQYSYTSEFMLRFPVLYLAVLFVSILMEIMRSETQKQLEESKGQYRYLYRHDALTGLYNRYGISEYMDVQMTENDKASIIIIDIDDFKSINDGYGHEFGDEVLKRIAQRIPELMCNECHCCRWGGEEFLLIMRCKHDAVETAENIRREIEALEFTYGEEIVNVTVSVGVGVVNSDKKVGIHELIDVADKALYRSKGAGKNSISVNYV